MNSELDLAIAHVVRKSERERPLRDAERSDIRAHVYGVERHGVTMAELLRSARPKHPALTARLVALTALTYRQGTGGGAGARTAATLHPRPSGQGPSARQVALNQQNETLYGPPAPPRPSGRGIERRTPETMSTRELGVNDYR